MTRTLALSLALTLACAVFAESRSQVTTVILVRHAEKAAEPAADPPLTDAGQLRANELARVLGSAGIDAIYTTPFARTRATATPLAAALKVTPIEMRTGPTYAADMAATIIAKHRGSTVLVVGHSNSTQHVIHALGIADAPKIEESTFDNLFIVSLADGSEPRLTSLRYGAVAR